MKSNELNKELEQLTVDQLKEKLDQLRRVHFGLRLNLLAAQVKDYSQCKKMRKDIARVLTCIRQKELGLKRKSKE